MRGESRERRVQVFGPAYLDRVVRLGGPLLDPQVSPPLDQSVDGCWKFGPGLVFRDPDGGSITLELPADWPGPTGSVMLSHRLVAADDKASEMRAVRAVSWHDDLGGMGAGYAAALGGELVSALGPADDPASVAIAGLLVRYGIKHDPVRRSDHAADWTLLVTSGAFGDKLPVGFRGCHAALAPEAMDELAGAPVRATSASWPRSLTTCRRGS